MKITHARVRNFRCVRDSGEFSLEPSITCLVGKNEAGKTALLQALAHLHPLDGEKEEFEKLDFPRDLWSKFPEKDAPHDSKTVVDTTWLLDDEEAAAISQLLGPKALRSRKFSITKGYHELHTWQFDVDETAAAKFLIRSFDLHPEVAEGLNKCKSVDELFAALSAMGERTESELALLAHINAAFPRHTLYSGLDQLISPFIPSFVYIPEYFTLPGKVSIEHLKTREAKGNLDRPDRVFLALLSMVGATIKQLEDEGHFENLSAELEAVSNQLSQDIFRYWTQNKYLRVKISFDAARPKDAPPFNSGFIVRTRIENTRHHVTVDFDERSAGFVWFFSFLVWFSQAKKNYGKRLVILLDEPGLSLHAKAQEDLLRYIEEKLAGEGGYQVIYSAHSPFMIDPRDLLRVRTVEDVYFEPKEGEPHLAANELGTKVGDQALSTDKDTVFPLQAALAYGITQSLFVGNHTLLVEGPSEILYLEWFKKKLSKLGRVSLDRRWTICPCGGVDKIPAFVSLFSGNKLHIAVLADFALGQKTKMRDLRESKLLKDGHVLTADMYVEQAEADIEDLVGRAAYCDLVKKAYNLPQKHALPKTRPATASIRVVKEAEAHFRSVPPDIPEFDHYQPSEYLTRQGIEFDLVDQGPALDRFEKLFSDLNSLLPGRE